MKVLLFGAGRAAENLIAEYILKDLNFHIEGILDNDRAKWGKNKSGIQIYSPREGLYKLENRYDKIIVASENYKEIKEQLMYEFNLEESIIEIAPKSLISSRKSYRPFEIPKIYKIACDILYDLCMEFNKYNLKYFVDHGTLLGLVRHGDIMTWDDDIDFSILKEDFGIAKKIFKDYFKMKFFNNKNIHVDIEHQKDYYGRSKVIKALVYITIEGEIHTIVVDLVYIHFEKNLAYQKLTYAPKKYFSSNNFIKYKNIDVRVPCYVEEYLSYHYGKDWKIVKKDIGWDSVVNRIFKNEI